MAPLAVAVVLLAAAFGLGLTVAAGWTMPVDRVVLRALAEPVAADPRLRRVALAVTHCGDPLTRDLITIGGGLLLMFRRHLLQALLLVGVSFGANAANSLLKLAVARPRPDLLPHLDPVTTLSFPSGHAANSAALYLTLAFLGVRHGAPRWTAWGAAILVGLIGLSRPALAVHWPSDVVAGWLTGTAWALLGLALLEWSGSRSRA